ncbi:hypothetical protein JAAARDRAFT_39145 [Jaapia argillacea MUCL 33604]|uniref:DNA ligase n=1 Tax=Jaapia argillacea MUCL 33604 TaxID=933084 RepID=A0A067PT06_9AGAM|nr:hypothetical protein JAAARDRAFT_39145 [Jaapia argillacea MUCL 33604]
MAKRTLSSTPSPVKQNKKSKIAPDQRSLDAFFGASQQRVNSGDNIVAGASPFKDKGKGKADDHHPGPGDGPLQHAELVDDERYAMWVAKQDGIGLDTMESLERGFRSARMPGTPRGEGPVVIDVDLVDVEGSSAIHATSSKPSDLSDRSAQRRKRATPPSSSSGQGSSILPSVARTGTRSNDSSGAETIVNYQPLDVDLAAFDPDAYAWPPNAQIPYSFLAHTLSTLVSTRSRIAILNCLTNTLRVVSRVQPSSLLPTLYLLTNSLSPPYEPIELGLGPSLITKAIQNVSGLSAAALRRLYNATGDPGDVAFAAKSNVRTLVPHPPLLITSVYDSLLKVARVKGQGAAKQKQAIVERLLVAAKGEEVRFLVRTLCQNLRVGAVRTSILTALARAMAMSPPISMTVAPSVDSEYHADAELLSMVEHLRGPEVNKKKAQEGDESRAKLLQMFGRAESLVKKVFVQHPNYDHIVAALLDTGLDALAERVPLTVGMPLHPTLGSPTKSLDEIYERLEDLPFTAEFKYDGQRAQIHAARSDGERTLVGIFSRNLEDMTTKYPDVVQLVHGIFERSTDIKSFIIDAEIVGIHPDTGELRTFQELSNRARKDVQMGDVKVAVCVFIFDLMYLNEEILLGQPFRERRSILRTNFPPFVPDRKTAARLDHVQSCESEEGREAVEEFWQKAVDSRSEGLMIKLLDSGEVLETSLTKKEKPRRKPLPATYEPDKRTSAWLKLKKDYVTGLGDSLDLVPIGAWHGNGRKAQWWSPILLALWDPRSGRHVAVCKCMSGFSDVFYKALSVRYPENSDTCSTQPLWDCDTGGLKPGVYFKPQEVWEIRGADVTISPVSVAALGLVSPNKGLSLRFPRFMKVRNDKGVDAASSPEFLANIYHSQQGKGRDRTGVDDGDLVDVSMESEDNEDGSDEDDVAL